MTYEQTLVDSLVTGAYSLINSIDSIQFFGIGAFTWILIIFVGSFAVELIGSMIGGKKDGN